MSNIIWASLIFKDLILCGSTLTTGVWQVLVHFVQHLIFFMKYEFHKIYLHPFIYTYLNGSIHSHIWIEKPLKNACWPHLHYKISERILYWDYEGEGNFVLFLQPKMHWRKFNILLHKLFCEQWRKPEWYSSPKASNASSHILK